MNNNIDWKFPDIGEYLVFHNNVFCNNVFGGVTTIAERPLIRCVARVMIVFVTADIMWNYIIKPQHLYNHVLIWQSPLAHRFFNRCLTRALSFRIINNHHLYQFGANRLAIAVNNEVFDSSPVVTSIVRGATMKLSPVEKGHNPRYWHIAEMMTAPFWLLCQIMIMPVKIFMECMHRIQEHIY